MIRRRAEAQPRACDRQRPGNTVGLEPMACLERDHRTLGDSAEVAINIEPRAGHVVERGLNPLRIVDLSSATKAERHGLRSRDLRGRGHGRGKHIRLRSR
jgi:hypothetical protein